MHIIQWKYIAQRCEKEKNIRNKYTIFVLDLKRPPNTSMEEVGWL